MRDASTRPRHDVYAELLVTVGLFAIPAALNAVYAYVASELHYGTVGIGWLFASRAAQELLLIGLFFYVLRANGERLADFTKPAQWGDVPRTVGLLLASWLPYVLVMAALWRKPRISFRHFSGSGPLSIYWHDGPYGDAVEAVKGRGVAWLAPNGELLGVEFDDVASPADAQTLELPNGDVVTVRVTRGKVTVRQRHRGRKTSAA